MHLEEYNFTDRNSKDGLLHTPEGVRDIYNSECARKLKVQELIHNELQLYGFKDIQTPTFEFFDIFNKERGTICSKEMYKFFDREGNTLVLRPDITPSIARCAAKYYKDETLPIRLCYAGNTYINNSRYQGKLKEVTQLGAELINDDSVDADAQMIALTIETLLKVGLTDFQVELGHADFFNGLVEEANLNLDEIIKLKGLIETKNMFGVEDFVATHNISTQLGEMIIKLPELFGTQENLEYAKSHTTNQRALQAVNRIENLTEILDTYGLREYVTFDLGMLSRYDYYNGIIFKAYTYGTGEVIITGGRYDRLVGQFGKEAPAIGLAIVIDQLMIALQRQKIDIPVLRKNVLVLYEVTSRIQAIKLCNKYRSVQIPVELLDKKQNKELNEYLEYAKRNENPKLVYIESSECVHIIDVLKNERKTVQFSELV